MSLRKRRLQVETNVSTLQHELEQQTQDPFGDIAASTELPKSFADSFSIGNDQMQGEEDTFVARKPITTKERRDNFSSPNFFTKKEILYRKQKRKLWKEAAAALLIFKGESSFGS